MVNVGQKTWHGLQVWITHCVEVICSWSWTLNNLVLYWTVVFSQSVKCFCQEITWILWATNTAYLIGAVHYIDTVLVPAEHPAVLEEAGDEPQLPVSGPVRTTGAWAREELKMRHILVEEWLEYMRLLYAPTHVCSPETKAWPSRVHQKVTLLAQSRLKTGAKLAVASRE